MDTAPIDIKYGEVLNWLESRFLIPKDWPKRLELLNLKKNELLDSFFTKDSPEMKKLQETFKIFKGNYDAMTYTDVNRLYNMLSRTEEAKSKTLFGNYTSQFIHDAYLLVGIYNKNNMHLAESSKLILQAIGYDIPSLEKNNQGGNSTINEYHSKINERNSQLEKNRNKIKDFWKKYNIVDHGDNVNAGVIALMLINRLFSLPSSLKNLENMIKNKKMENAIKIYQNFYEKIYRQPMDKEFLSNLKILMNELNVNQNKNDQEEIIKTKIQEYQQKYENIDIQADLEAQMWNFKLVSGGNGEKVKTLPPLLNPQIRKQIKNDLNEILVFVTHRLSQLDNKDEINLSIFQPNLLELSLEITQEKLIEAKQYLKSVIECLEHPDLTFLFNIFDDEKNIKTILNNFELLKVENKKIVATNSDNQNKINELEKEIGENDKRIAQIKKDAKLVKKQMEKFLTDTLKRKITIIGDINLI